MFKIKKVKKIQTPVMGLVNCCIHYVDATIDTTPVRLLVITQEIGCRQFPDEIRYLETHGSKLNLHERMSVEYFSTLMSFDKNGDIINISK